LNWGLQAKKNTNLKGLRNHLVDGDGKEKGCLRKKKKGWRWALNMWGVCGTKGKGERRLETLEKFGREAGADVEG